MSQKIYILMTCDEWKSRDSMRIYAACTSMPTLRRLISDGIRNKVFSYGNLVSFSKQARKFRDEWKTRSAAPYSADNILQLCNEVKYAYVEECVSGVVC